jgi:hypothetical protein
MLVRTKSETISVDVSRDPNEKFKEVPRDLILAKGESITIELPSEAVLILLGTLGESLLVYPDPDDNPSLTYEITKWDRDAG